MNGTEGSVRHATGTADFNSATCYVPDATPMRFNHCHAIYNNLRWFQDAFALLCVVRSFYLGVKLWPAPEMEFSCNAMIPQFLRILPMSGY